MSKQSIQFDGIKDVSQFKLYEIINKSLSLIQRAWKKTYGFIYSFSPSGKIGLVLLSLIFLMALLAPWISIHPHRVSSGPSLIPPAWPHILGTDELGIDLWAQICFGARVSLLVGISTALLAGFVGGAVGIVAGYIGGLVDKMIMRLVDIMIVLPDLPVMIVLAAFFGPVNITLFIPFQQAVKNQAHFKDPRPPWVMCIGGQITIVPTCQFNHISGFLSLGLTGFFCLIDLAAVKKAAGESQQD
jgi:ABC-type dipeptide/oligopeptide/nickel transport system permease subunit